MNPKVRERVRLVITKTKKGFAGKIVLENGKELHLSSWEFNNDSLNGKECEIERPKGTVEKLYIDGKEYPKKSSSPAPKQSQSPHGGGTHGGQKPHGKAIYENPWHIENTQLPKDTRSLIGNQDDIENYYLLLNKAAQLIEEGKEGKKFKLFVHDKPKGGGSGKKLRIEPNGFKGVDFESIIKRSEYCRASAKEYVEVKIRSLRPEWRMVVGLGGESVYETSMTLHHVYGFPYIPGSAVKGVTRHYMVTALLGALFPDEDLAVLDKAIDLVGLEEIRKAFSDGRTEDAAKAVEEGLRVSRKNEKSIYPGDGLIKRILSGWDELNGMREVFGNQSQRGKVIFLDAYPEAAPKIKADIMNPHFSDYYMSKEPPADHLSPIPVHFLTVEDTPFSFAIMAKKEDRSILDTPIGGRKISEWVMAALTEHGIGAKTSVGYGYFTETKSQG